MTESGSHSRDEAPTVMMGMSSIEWSAYLREELGVPWKPTRSIAT